MKPEELFDALRKIADACCDSQQNIASVLYTLCGCMAYGDNDAIHRIAAYTASESRTVLEMNEQTKGNVRLT